MGFPFCLITAPNWLLLAPVWIPDWLLKYRYDNKLSWAMTHLMSSNALCSTDFHLKATFSDGSVSRGYNKCDCLYQMSLL